MTFAFPKPSKGTSRAERLDRRAEIVRIENHAKLAAKVRDGYRCRVPGCTTNTKAWRPESAHLVTKGMGGDHGLHSHHRRDFVTACYLHHQGQRSLHSGDLKAVPLTAEAGDGLVQWLELREGGWTVLGVS